MLELEYTAGSPYARAVRILLHELDLPYLGREPDSAPTSTQLRASTPTMQVPTLRDGEVVLWESGTIADYLLRKSSRRSPETPLLAPALWRPAHEWEDKLLFSTIQTLGGAATTISQLTWTGVTVRENAHLQRCAERTRLILRWLEDRLPEGSEGFWPGAVSVQEIFLACHIRFIQARPLGLELDLARLPRCRALLERLDARRSFIATPLRWWDPEVIGYAADGSPLYDDRS